MQMGLVPRSGAAPKVGTTVGPVVVIVIPAMPSATARRG